jgi:hypothetical protein
LNLIKIHLSALGVCSKIKDNEQNCAIKRRKLHSTTNLFIRKFKTRVKNVFNKAKRFHDRDEGSRNKETTTLTEQISQFFKNKVFWDLFRKEFWYLVVLNKSCKLKHRENKEKTKSLSISNVNNENNINSS